MGPISATIRFPAYPPCAGLGRRDLKSGTRGTSRARTTGMRERARQPGRGSPNSPLAGTTRVHDGYPQRSPRLRRGDGIRRPDGASGHAEARCIAFARLSWGFDSPRLHRRETAATAVFVHRWPSARDNTPAVTVYRACTCAGAALQRPHLALPAVSPLLATRRRGSPLPSPAGCELAGDPGSPQAKRSHLLTDAIVDGDLR